MSDKMLENVYQEIKELDKRDFCSMGDAFCKFTEESGEWVREINKTTGRKIRRESSDEIQENILEEAADTLQNYLLICGRFNIDLSVLLKKISEKNIKWEEQIEERQLQVELVNGKTQIIKDGKVYGSQG